jgi:BirA family biotin operon repressor/biotin-[acetyl-CoA-carboxylase] ligase
VVIADAQGRGRGRYGRAWFSPPGLNIYMSTLLRPESVTFSPPLISISASLAVVRAIHSLEEGALNTVRERRNSSFLHYDSQQTMNVWPKWPNDIYSNNKKLGGILSESSIKKGKSGFFVTGIGVNVNMKREDIPENMQETATSIYLETGTMLERGLLIMEILKSLQKCFRMLHDDPSSLIASWCRLSKTINTEVIASTPAGEVTGRAVGVDDKGFLIIQQRTGKEIRVSSADVIHLC